MHSQSIRTHRVFKPIISIAAAGAIAGIVAFLTTLAPPAPEANALANSPALPQAAANVNSLKGTACSVHGWPDFEQSCQFDFRKPANEARKVRIIAVR